MASPNRESAGSGHQRATSHHSVRSSKPTVRDIAAAAGVSVATVSRALRGLDNVDETTRFRVIDAARSLNYAATPSAVRLATGRAGTIGIIAPFVGGWYFSEIFAGIEERLRAHDVDLLMQATEDFSTLGHPDALNRFRPRVDGAIVVGVSLGTVQTDRAVGLGLPLVTVGSTSPQLSSVGIDDRRAARAAVEHLINSGHERIALLSGRQLPTPIEPENARLAGFVDALRAHGLVADTSLVRPGDFTAAGGERATVDLLAHPSPPTAIFSMSDEMAYGALRALRRAGWVVGGSARDGGFGVVGFDGHHLAEAFDLTTVEQPVRDLGRTAVDMLMTQVRDRSVASLRHTVLPTCLVRRSSSGG